MNLLEPVPTRNWAFPLEPNRFQKLWNRPSLMLSQLLLKSGEKISHWACVAGFVWVMFWSTLMLMFNRPGHRLTLCMCAVCAQQGDMKRMFMLEKHMFIVIYVYDMAFLDGQFMIYICHNKNIPPKKVIHFSKKGMLAKLAMTCGFFEGASRQTGHHGQWPRLRSRPAYVRTSTAKYAKRDALSLHIHPQWSNNIYALNGSCTVRIITLVRCGCSFNCKSAVCRLPLPLH